MEFNFPEILTTRTLAERIQKVRDELIEFEEKFDDDELVDVLHTVETLIRGHFEGRIDELDDIIRRVKEKNMKRGYYTKACF